MKATKKASKANYEVFEFSNGYFGITEKGNHGAGCVYGGDSACEDHYNQDYINEVFENWNGELNYTGDQYGYRIDI